MPDCPASQAGLPATPVGELAVACDHTGGANLAEEAAAHSPAVGPEATGQHQRAQSPIILDEQSQIAVPAAQVDPNGMTEYARFQIPDRQFVRRPLVGRKKTCCPENCNRRAPIR